MSRRSYVFAAACSLAAIGAPLVAAGAQSQVTISPFMSVLPAGGASPLAGLALTLGGAQTGFGLRASGNLALQSSNTSPFTSDQTRPWGADADALLFLGGRGSGSSRLALAPYVFAGVGVTSTDSLGFADRTSNWSYGAGLAVPFGSALDLFGEARWRMSQFMLPTASDAYSPTTELRFGVSFHVGGSSDDDARPRSRGRR